MPGISSTCPHDLRTCLEAIFYQTFDDNQYHSEDAIAYNLELSLKGLYTLIALITDNEYCDIPSLRNAFQSYENLATHFPELPMTTAVRDLLVEDDFAPVTYPGNEDDGLIDIINDSTNKLVPQHTSAESSSTSSIIKTNSSEKKAVLNHQEIVAYRTLEIFHHFNIPYPTQTILASQFLNKTVSQTKNIIDNLISYGVIELTGGCRYNSIQFCKKKPKHYAKSFYEIDEFNQGNIADVFDSIFRNSENERQIYINYCLNESQRKTINLEELKPFVEQKILAHKTLICKKSVNHIRKSPHHDLYKYKILRSLLAYQFTKTNEKNRAVSSTEIADAFGPPLEEEKKVTAKQKSKYTAAVIDNALQPKNLVELIDPDSFHKRYQLPKHFSFMLVSEILALENSNSTSSFPHVLTQFSLNNSTFGQDLFQKTWLENKEKFASFIEHLKTNTLEKWHQQNSTTQHADKSPHSDEITPTTASSSSMYSKSSSTLFKVNIYPENRDASQKKRKQSTVENVKKPQRKKQKVAQEIPSETFSQRTPIKPVFNPGEPATLPPCFIAMPAFQFHYHTQPKNSSTITPTDDEKFSFLNFLKK